MGEEAMCCLERELDRGLRLILSEGPSVGVSADVRNSLGFSMAVQYLRTRAFRDQIRDQAVSFLNNTAEELVGLNFPEKRHLSPRAVIGDDMLAVLHLRAILDYGLWKSVGKSLETHIWLLMKCAPGASFVTSDNPVSRRATLRGRDSTGFKSKGIQIVYPLSPAYGLLMVERTARGALAQYDGDVVLLSPEQTIAANEIVAANADRFIFGSQDAFPPLTKFFERNQALKAKRWDTWRTESGRLRLAPSEEGSSPELRQPMEHFIDPITIHWSDQAEWVWSLSESVNVSRKGIPRLGF